MDILDLIAKYGGSIEEEKKADFGKEFRKIYKHESELAAAKEEAEALKQQLTARDADIEKLAAESGDVEKLKGQLTELQEKYKAETESFQKQIAERDYKDAIKSAIAQKGIRFSSKGAEKAYTSELLAAGLRVENGELTGFDDFHRRYQEGDPDAFQAMPLAAKGMQGGPPPAVSEAARYAQETTKRLQGVG